MSKPVFKDNKDAKGKNSAQQVSFEQRLTQNGICAEYVDAWGKPKRVADENLMHLLNALDDDETCCQNLDIYLKPVYVWKEDQHKDFYLQASFLYNQDKTAWDQDKIAQSFWQLKDEFGHLSQGSLSDLVNHKKINKMDEGLACYFPQKLVPGYYQLCCYVAGTDVVLRSRIIIAPRKCYRPSVLKKLKLWGPSIQLYTLRSEQNWGIGDFGDLIKLAEKLAPRGASYIGVNPLHSLFPHKPEHASPYSPSSRYWLNIAYIDMQQIDGLTPTTLEYIQSPEIQSKIQALREHKYVQYQEVFELKLAVLKRIFKELKTDAHPNLVLSFNAFKAHYGKGLSDYACYDAILDKDAKHPKNFNLEDWQSIYPTPEAKQTLVFKEENEELINFYCFAQWQANKQLEQVNRHMHELGMSIGLYRDLAVGVNGESSDTWMRHELFTTQVSIGAPPDVLNYQGQSWGLPPMKPCALADNAYKDFINLLRANLNACGALRIDHILGLLRLWWVPHGLSPKDGAYVHYPIDDLLSILALESHRHKCLIVGEDLGTIPESIKEKLFQAGILSYKVFFFNRAPDGGYYSPKDYPQQALATLCTHDMPTLRGYWHCLDIKLGQELGFFDDPATLDALYQERLEAKQQILNSLAWHGYLPQGSPQNAAQAEMTEELNQAFHLHLAHTNSALLSVQLEDWLNMEEAVNVPGTSMEYPNWRRKMSMNINDMFENERFSQFLNNFNQVRKEIKF